MSYVKNMVEPGPAAQEPRYFERIPSEQPIFVQKGKVAKALAAAQAEMEPPKMTGRNPFFKNSANPDGSKFATLSDVMKAILPVLAKHGLCLTQNLTSVEKGVECATVIWHESGEYFEFGPLFMPAPKGDAQAFGSAATYARRYSAMAACGLVGDDDEDGNAASGKAHKEPVDPRPSTVNVDPKLVDRYVSKALDIKSADLDDEGIDAAIYALHVELAPQHDLYCAVADALAEQKVIAKAAWKGAVSAHSKRLREAA